MRNSPTFLVASPSLTCDYFAKTVVLLVDHDAEGSFGFVINRASALELPAIFAELGLSQSDAVKGINVLRGGPVSPETGWVVFDREGAPLVPGDTIMLGSHLAVTASFEMLEAIARGDAPDRALLALGYAGWSPGQLESELKEGSWIPVDVDAETLFDIAYNDRWTHALGHLGIDPWRVITSGNAKA